MVNYTSIKSAAQALALDGQFIPARFNTTGKWKKPDKLKVYPGGDRLSGNASRATAISLKFIWVTGISEGIAFANFPDATTAANALAATRAGFQVRGRPATVTSATDNKSLKVTQLGPDVHELHLIQAFSAIGVQVSSAKVQRKEDPTVQMDSDFGVAESLALLYSLFTPFNATSVDIGILFV